jgi:uncharacterized membrane protein
MEKETSSRRVAHGIRFLGFGAFSLAVLLLAFYFGRLEGLGRPTGFYVGVVGMVWGTVYHCVWGPSKGPRKRT